MAKPRVFVSSTYFDLKHIRDRVQSFIQGMGFEPVLFESGDIPFQHDIALDLACYAEIQLCHMLILIVGSRYGSPTSNDDQENPVDIDAHYKFYNSITSEEYRTARTKDIPIFIFVERDVLAEYRTFKRNRERDIDYAHVDNINVFLLLDEIMAQQRNNFVRGFERFDDIADWLRDQWAGLFAEFLSKKASEPTLRDLGAQIAELTQVSNALKNYSKYVLQNIGAPAKESAKLINEEERKIEGARLKRFEEEPLISYLRIHATKSRLPVTDPADMFRLFIQSPSLDTFLSQLGFPDEFKTEFFEKHLTVARRDFDALRSRYLPGPGMAAPHKVGKNAKTSSRPKEHPSRTSSKRARPKKRVR
ncbi:MAG: hypothetical protein JWL77_7129 [Chthonomonadaceae bacterium]|nr:hypothetical protein [Chthonomonadaceae bacterium]